MNPFSSSEDGATSYKKANHPRAHEQGGARGGKPEQAGQALAESALVFLILFILLAGLVEFGWAYFRYLAMQNAAAEGAAYGTMFPNWHDSGDNPDPDNVEYRVRHESNSPLLEWNDTTKMQVDVDALFTTPGNHITVTVTYDHNFITPLTTWLPGGGSMTLRATAVQAILAPESS